MVEFINENYLWFIIGGAVLLMVLIGYIAEKRILDAVVK